MKRLEIGNVVDDFVVPAPVLAGVEDVVGARHEGEILLQTERHLRQHLACLLHAHREKNQLMETESLQCVKDVFWKLQLVHKTPTSE